ncbi:TPA: hypothetical protein ACMDPN_003516 [Vibrio cholerae]|uniref:hypothetical protein n=1 Tax=Vibrio TaxID=662 RepID=UPI000929E3AD|nr:MULTISPECIES: hypothetical protein [Vibrio]EGQ8391447.1 hypothetical protein [Vibrio cholerae]EGQ9395995.1 hypothetical protein [Vibrio cholerae]EJL8259124.1 hypothetical protein [Vibrio cholerae]EKF9704127.1 hypothetical protein [Vibrio cholerae]EKF9817719.1 hypothetical protein [Vibrio cholerae]
MELDKFVLETLTMISKGVSEAQENCIKYGVSINDVPVGTANNIGFVNHSTIQNVEFDVAVVTEDASAGEGKISVMGIGIGGGVSSKDMVTSRIKFIVPMTYARPRK